MKLKEANQMNKGYRIVMGVIGHDIHVVSNRIIGIALREYGYQVCNLGVDNTAENFLDATIEFEAHAVIVSSLNGEAEHWCNNFGTLFALADKKDVLKYLGGNLIVGNQTGEEVERQFLKFGFNRVFHRPQNLDVLFKSLKIDLLNGNSR
jgi:methylaspartate mutase sigma subunit